MRDYQKAKVYAWEDQVVAPRVSLQIPFERAQQYVDGVWIAHGWQHPPLVGLMAKQNKKHLADGCRTQIRIRDTTPAWLILHELAHTLTCDIDGRSDGHGPDFVGIYIQLLEDVEKISRLMCVYTLNGAKIDYNMVVKPWMERRR